MGTKLFSTSAGLIEDFKPTASHFHGPLPSFGNESLSIAIAGITVRFAGIPSSMMERTLRQYQPFLSSEYPLHVVQMRSGNPTYLQPARLLRLEQESHADGEILVSPEFAAMRMNDEQGILRISDPENADAVLRAMETYLRWVIASLAVKRNAFVLHSAGLVVEGSAFIFCGQSGAGKSTLTALSPHADVLSDDLVLIHKQGEQWLAATTPFAGSFPQSHKRAGSFPIRFLFSLRKSLEVRVSDLDPSIAAGLMLSNCPFISNEIRVSHLFPLIEDFVKNVPVRELHFRKDPSFWKLLV